MPDLREWPAGARLPRERHTPHAGWRAERELR